MQDVIDAEPEAEAEGVDDDDVEGAAPPSHRWKWVGIAVGAVALIGIGVVVGISLGSSSNDASDNGAATASSGGKTTVVDMSQGTTPKSCKSPVPPSADHPNAVLSQLFTVTSNANQQYLVGWQIVPYNGAQTYKLNDGGALLALEPPTTGRPLGFGDGTLTVDGDGTSGSVDATVTLANGDTLRITGPWSCS